MSVSRRFMAPGSPLHGKEVPRDWSDLTTPAKRRALVSYGYAANYDQACRVMGRHVAAVMRARRLKAEEEKRRIDGRKHPEGRD